MDAFRQTGVVPVPQNITFGNFSTWKRQLKIFQTLGETRGFHNLTTTSLLSKSRVQNIAYISLVRECRLYFVVKEIDDSCEKTEICIKNTWFVYFHMINSWNDFCFALTLRFVVCLRWLWFTDFSQGLTRRCSSYTLGQAFCYIPCQKYWISVAWFTVMTLVL